MFPRKSHFFGASTVLVTEPTAKKSELNPDFLVSSEFVTMAPPKLRLNGQQALRIARRLRVRQDKCQLVLSTGPGSGLSLTGGSSAAFATFRPDEARISNPITLTGF